MAGSGVKPAGTNSVVDDPSDDQGVGLFKLDSDVPCMCVSSDVHQGFPQYPMGIALA
jgi:hypothetical protein